MPEDQARSQDDSGPDSQELGFGKAATRQGKHRLLNRDGSFNAGRIGQGPLRSLSPYHALLTMPWWRFNGIVLSAYLLTNILFAFAYMACGEYALSSPADAGEGFSRAFFFSVQTLATLGFGHIHPVGVVANLLVTLEALVGMLAIALMTGLAFARFSRPSAKIRFSREAVLAPFGGGRGFMFRMANERRNELTDLRVKILYTAMEDDGVGDRRRRIFELDLEREQLLFFPPSWAVVHPVDSDSPLAGKGEAELRAEEAEFLIMFQAFDESFAQTVQTRTSYRAEEVRAGRKFVKLIRRDDDSGAMTADISMLDETEAAAIHD